MIIITNNYNGRGKCTLQIKGHLYTKTDLQSHKENNNYTVPVNTNHAGIGFTEQKMCLLFHISENVTAILRIPCTYFKVFFMVVPDIVTKSHNVDIFYKNVFHRQRKNPAKKPNCRGSHGASDLKRIQTFLRHKICYRAQQVFFVQI